MVDAFQQIDVVVSSALLLRDPAPEQNRQILPGGATEQEPFAKAVDKNKGW